MPACSSMVIYNVKRSYNKKCNHHCVKKQTLFVANLTAIFQPFFLAFLMFQRKLKIQILNFWAPLKLRYGYVTQACPVGLEGDIFWDKERNEWKKSFSFPSCFWTLLLFATAWALLCLWRNTCCWYTGDGRVERWKESGPISQLRTPPWNHLLLCFFIALGHRVVCGQIRRWAEIVGKEEGSGVIHIFDTV